MAHALTRCQQQFPTVNQTTAVAGEPEITVYKSVKSTFSAPMQPLTKKYKNLESLLMEMFWWLVLFCCLRCTAVVVIKASFFEVRMQKAWGHIVIFTFKTAPADLRSFFTLMLIRSAQRSIGHEGDSLGLMWIQQPQMAVPRPLWGGGLGMTIGKLWCSSLVVWKLWVDPTMMCTAHVWAKEASVFCWTGHCGLWTYEGALNKHGRK